MTLDEVRAVILESSPADWHRIDRGSATFLYGFVTEGEHREVHDARAVYKLNVAIGVAWGLKANADYHADWLEAFPDSSGFSEFIDVLYHGNPVDRHVRVVVDGGRAALPSPEPIVEGEFPNTERVGWKTTRDEYESLLAFERLFSAEGAENFVEYFERSGIQIRD